MGAQIIQQPNGLFAVFSSHSDTIATEEDILAYCVTLAVRDTTRRVAQLLEQVRSGHPAEAYHQFALTWDEAVAMDRDHGGDAGKHLRAEGTGPSQGPHIQSADAGPAVAPRPDRTRASQPPLRRGDHERSGYR